VHGRHLESRQTSMAPLDGAFSFERLAKREPRRPVEERGAGSIASVRGRKGAAYSGSTAPIFFGLALHRRRVRVLEFEPVAGAAGDVTRAAAPTDDPFEAKLGGMTRFKEEHTRQ
jgi:hypothetical protein